MSGQLISPMGSATVAAEVFRILEEVISDKEALGLPDKWLRFYELGKNKHWRKNAPNLTLTSANLLSVHRRRTINALTNNNPTFNVKRIVSSDDSEDRFKMILRSTEYWWNETEQQDIFELSVFNGETYGVCIEKSVFDLEKEYGIGEVDSIVVDPYYFGVYPVKCLDNQKASVNLHYYPMSVSEIKRKFGAAASEVKPDYEIANSVSDSRRYVSGIKDVAGSTNSGSVSIGGTIKNLLSTAFGTTAVGSDEAIVCECWVKDYSVDPKTGKALYYGNIRAITVVNGTIVLKDQNNPSINPRLPIELAVNTYLFDKFPFAKANSNKDPINFWGECDFEQLAGLQMEFNKSLSQFSSLKDKVAGVKFVNPKTSGVHNDKIKTGVTVLNPDTLNHGMGWIPPPPIPRELVESVSMYKELFFAVAGTFDLEQANTPGSQVIAYKAIAALLERVSAMMSGKIRNYSKLIRDRGRMAVSQMQNWYTEERFITFAENGDEQQATVLGKDMIVPMKLSVVSGSTMPVSDVQRREEALTLYDKGAIDVEELLKKLNWDKHAEVANRMKMGPVGEFLQRMQMVGMPEEMLGYFNEIASIDANKLERVIERHEVPMFTETFVFEGIQPDVKQQIATAKANAEVQESTARAQKLMAEKVAIEAEANKRLNHVRQTDDRIKIDRAKVVHESIIKSKELEKKDATA